MSNLKKNLSYQTFYQILVTITPLITAPYLSRKLGADSIGIYSFTQSIVNYFTLFAMLGFINYGTRTIAMSDSKEETRKNFVEIYYLQIISTLFVSIIYSILLLLINNNKVYIAMQSLWIVSCFFDVTWYFFGKEKFKVTVIRNTIIKILTVIAIIFFVKSPNDLWKYIIIMGGSTLLSQLCLWIIIRKEIKLYRPNFDELKKHIKPILILFVPILAMTVFHVMDKTMLGMLSTNEQSGFYYNSDKVVNIPLGIITGIGTVMLSKISSMKKNNGKDQTIKAINISIKIIMCFGIAMAFGIAAISKEFVPVFFGEGYEECIKLIMIFSIIIIFKIISDILRTQYMIPFNKEKYFIIAVFAGAIVNLLSNFIFIYLLQLGALGATLGTLIAEMVVCFIQLILTCKNIKILGSFVYSVKYIAFGIIMFLTVRITEKININLMLIKLILEIMIGMLTYSIITILYFRLFDREILDLLIKKKRVSIENNERN